MKQVLKEPWQMTRSVYSVGVGWAEGKNPAILHKESVIRALSEGKPVPVEVLKDYPELAK